MASSTVFVSNFPFATTEDELRARFEELSAVRGVRIIVDRETGRSRGFAFVELVDPTVMDSVIEALDNSDFKGRRLAVSKARGRSGAPLGSDLRARPPAGPRGVDASTPRTFASPLRHRIVIDWIEAANAYAASVPDLGITVQAPSVESAAREVHERALRELAAESERSQGAG